jgi:peptide/nickel transport system substrate-binding protein
MIRRQISGLGALAATAALILAACNGSGGSSAGAGNSPTPPSSDSAHSSYGAAISGVVNPSAASGGTMIWDLDGTPGSTDYQNMYSSYMWDFARLYSMQLLTYKSCPGPCGLQLVPSLATGLGTPSDGGRIWTYHLKPNVKFQNGDPVTSADVKYGVERTFARITLPAGPVYYQVLLQDNGYPGPYVDRAKNIMGLTSVTTPDKTTVVFHLNQPFADFNYVVAIPQSTPLEPSWDTGAHGGANLQFDPESTGPYQFQSYSLHRQLILVPNRYWNPSTDPQVKQLAGKIIVNMGGNQTAVDQNLLANHAQVDINGLGVQAAAQDRILTDPSLKADSDDPTNGFLRFAYINTEVIPNLHCREAIEYAADKTTLQDAYGGPVAGGQIASTVLPPTVIGYQNFDLYKATSMPGGDAKDAKAQLQRCGKPGGFSFTIAYRTDTPGDRQAATALQAALKSVGISTTLLGFPTARYYTNFAGVPNYVHSHDIGMAIGSWGADWPDGYGFLYDLSDGSAIIPFGNVNIAEINDPVINGLFHRAMTTVSSSAATATWPKIDMKIMKDAAVLPIVYQKVLLYRPPDVTNVYLDEVYGMYNYAVLGLKK